MTVVTQPSAPALSDGDTARVVVRHWRLPIVFAVFSVIAILLFLVFPRSGTTVYTFSTKNDFFTIPNVSIPSIATGIVVTIIAVAITVVAFVLVSRGRSVPLWLSAIFAVALLVGFITWSVGNGTVPVAGLLAAALGLSVPIIYGAMGGVLSERVGVVNVAIEGQLLGGAFTSAILATITHSVVVGLIGAAVAGVIVSLILAAFSIKYLVDQVIVGIVLNVLVSGVTGFFYTAVMANNTAAFNLPPTLPNLPIPLLSQIPVIGPVLFNQTLIVYVMYVAVAGVYYFLFHTRWGLRVRAVGEHPKAADTVGVKVNPTRFWTVLIAGAIAGFGGAYFTIGGVGGFVKDMTSGLGYIALAAVIFGRWDPIRATLAALLFGFAGALQSLLGLLHAPIPSEFLRMLPYLVTIFAVAGLVGMSRGPAASGKPYIKS
ncbi:ABC transporter permease [Leifsonia sp. TF02-11]|uniref:ABC transporter permease n=1 Tax=Leifsonia sp. TF02-11 TaxID=2815212 RepID=UPI001AA0D6FA|nr:ABC transporter permease [Leifsonia sp. TF02-11]MBO1737437.1 ABC transporter permease [Leifsonia sp. TF02-11]